MPSKSDFPKTRKDENPTYHQERTKETGEKTRIQLIIRKEPKRLKTSKVKICNDHESFIHFALKRRCSSPALGSHRQLYLYNCSTFKARRFWQKSLAKCLPTLPFCIVYGCLIRERNWVIRECIVFNFPIFTSSVFSCIIMVWLPSLEKSKSLSSNDTIGTQGLLGSISSSILRYTL